MYDPADPALASLRALTSTLPGTTEKESWGRPTFRAPTKIYAVYGAGQERPHGLIIKPEPDERPALLADARFFSPPYFGPSGWLALDLDLDAGIDWLEIVELLASSYRQVASATLVSTLDAAGPDPLRLTAQQIAAERVTAQQITAQQVTDR